LVATKPKKLRLRKKKQRPNQQLPAQPSAAQVSLAAADVHNLAVMVAITVKTIVRMQAKTNSRNKRLLTSLQVLISLKQNPQQ